MDLEKTPGLTGAEQAAVAAYQEAHVLYAGSALDTLLNSGSSEEEKAEGAGRAVAQIEQAYSRLSELARSSTPGREGAMGYGQLLSLLRGLGLGERAVAMLDDPPVPWGELPEARLLVFCCLDLMHYSFLTGGALDHAVGRSRKQRLYDVPETVRAEMREEEEEGLTHPDDVTAEQFLGMWLDPGLPPEERHELVLESLKADCEVREDNGNLWRL
jgi:hypothetical protein